MKYRLGLDMGATSLGWCVLELDENDIPRSVTDMGVRIFSDGRNAKDKKPLSVSRREKRAARRNRDRFILRRNDLIKALVDHDLMPKDKVARKSIASIDPYQSRASAVKEKVSLHVLGRSLFHINQRRGFKSNRIVDQQDGDDELTGMKSGIELLRGRLAERTLGQYLFDRHQKLQSVRMRPHQGKSNKNEWDFYADRAMYEEEFYRIMEEQRKHHSILTEDLISKFHDIIFRQRELRQPEPGWCALIHGERRMQLAMPVYQKFRILQEVNNLEIDDFGEETSPITAEDRNVLVQILTQSFESVTNQGYLSWSKISKALGYKGKVVFNLERTGNKGIFCDRTSRELSEEGRFGKQWFAYDIDKQALVINQVLHETNNSKLLSWLIENIGVTSEQAQNICEARLQKGYGRLSEAAVKRLVPHMVNGFKYDKACQNEGINHSDRHTGEIFDKGDLPYYGEILSRHALGGDHRNNKSDEPEAYFGKINNPTVHIALNQLRLVINTLYKRYQSAPQEIHIELARDLKLPQEKLREIEQTQKANRELNDRIDEILLELGVASNYDNRMRYKLWSDLAREPDRRVCPYSGKPIPLSELFTERFDVDHLLPFSKSFDDGRANKVVCTRASNRWKNNQTPFEAFGHSPDGYDWSAILARVENLHTSKRWRFQPDAMARIKGNEDSMIARLLTDTQYMSRVAREYLTYVLEDHARVIAPTGKLTAKLRHHWGFNSLLSPTAVKERGDHRHHAVDALVVACTSQSMIQQVSRAASKAEAAFLEASIKDLGAPFPKFDRSQLQGLVDEIVISHKADNSTPLRATAKNQTKGQLHEETNWGMIGPSDKNKNNSVFATRVPLVSIENKEKSILEVANEIIREDLLAELQVHHSKASWGKFLDEYASRHNIRRVRIHRSKSNAGMIPIKDKEGNPYRYVQGGSNFCLDIWCTDKGPKAGKWQACPISMFDAHQLRGEPPWREGNPTAWRVMRLHIGDAVVYEADGKELIVRVKKTGTDGRVYLRDHRIAKETADKLSWCASATQLQIRNARRVWVDPLGRIHDAGKARKVK